MFGIGLRFMPGTPICLPLHQRFLWSANITGKDHALVGAAERPQGSAIAHQAVCCWRILQKMAIGDAQHQRAGQTGIASCLQLGQMFPLWQFLQGGGPQISFCLQRGGPAVDPDRDLYVGVRSIRIHHNGGDGDRAADLAHHGQTGHQRRVSGQLDRKGYGRRGYRRPSPQTHGNMQLREALAVASGSPGLGQIQVYGATPILPITRHQRCPAAPLHQHAGLPVGRRGADRHLQRGMLVQVDLQTWQDHHFPLAL